MGSQILRNSKIYLQILGSRRGTYSSILRTQNSGVTCGPDYLLLSARCMLIHFFVYKRENCNNSDENIRCHRKKTYWAGRPDVHDLCTSGLGEAKGNFVLNNGLSAQNQTWDRDNRSL